MWSDPRERSTPVAAPPPPPADGMLPGWKAVVDKSSGRTYYYDTVVRVRVGLRVRVRVRTSVCTIIDHAR